MLCSQAVAEEKRTKIGPTGPLRAVRETGAQAVAGAAGTPIPASTPPGATPGVPTSYRRWSIRCSARRSPRAT